VGVDARARKPRARSPRKISTDEAQPRVGRGVEQRRGPAKRWRRRIFKQQEEDQELAGRLVELGGVQRRRAGASGASAPARTSSSWATLPGGNETPERQALPKQQPAKKQPRRPIA
jgi:hypothetical protein